MDTSTGAPIPDGMGASGTAEENGNIHLMAGTNTGGFTTDHRVYNVAGNSWTTAASVPIITYGPGAVQLSGLLYLIGGGDPAAAPGSPDSMRALLSAPKGKQKAPLTSYNTTRIYDPATDS